MVKPGDIYNWLTILEVLKKREGRGHVMVRVLCKCGKEFKTRRARVVSGATKACGCYLRKSNGLYQTSEYHCWESIIARCTNQKDPRYKGYGGKGISVCERWRGSFLNFLADMGQRPAPDLSIDRINNDGNYEPGNCRWADSKTQSRNTSRNKFYIYKGQRLILNDWAPILGISKSALRQRLKKMTVDEAFSKPSHYKKTSTHPIRHR